MNKRTMKKGLAIVLALVMVFAMTATAFAATGNGYSVVGTATTYTQPIHVKVVLDTKKDSSSGNAISEVYNVQLGSVGMSARSFSVCDAMVALDAMMPDEFVIYADAEGNELTNDSTYLYGISNGDDVYFPCLLKRDHIRTGWLFI